MDGGREPGPVGSQPFRFCGFCGNGFGKFQNPAVPCTTDSQCTDATFAFCRQRTSGAFAQGPARTISETGSPAGVCIDDGTSHAANLVSVFCVPPTFNATVDAAGDPPAPGAICPPGGSPRSSPLPLWTSTPLALSATTPS